jgi:hypothetical protein
LFLYLISMAYAFICLLTKYFILLPFLNKEQRYAVFHLILHQIKLANELLIKAFGKFLTENETKYLVGHIQNVNNLAMFSPFFIYYKYMINKYFYHSHSAFLFKCNKS